MMEHVVLDTSILLSFPQVLARRITDIVFVVPFDVQIELRSHTGLVLGQGNPLADLYNAAVREGIITIELPRAQIEAQKRLFTEEYGVLVSTGDYGVIATAHDLREEGKSVHIATEDKALRRAAERNHISVWGMEEIRAKCLAGTSVERLGVCPSNGL
jgi:rRNA maturation endonuclease Nob1